MPLPRRVCYRLNSPLRSRSRTQSSRFGRGCLDGLRDVFLVVICDIATLASWFQPLWPPFLLLSASFDFTGRLECCIQNLSDALDHAASTACPVGRRQTRLATRSVFGNRRSALGCRLLYGSIRWHPARSIFLPAHSLHAIPRRPRPVQRATSGSTSTTMYG